MAQAQPRPKTSSGPGRALPVCLAQIIACLQEQGHDDRTVVAVVVEMMQKGCLRRPPRAEATGLSQAA